MNTAKNIAATSILLTATCTKIIHDVGKYWFIKLYESFLEPNFSKQQVVKARNTAKTFQEWAESSRILDSLEGNDKWKAKDESTHFDYELVRNRLQQMEDAELLQDENVIQFLLRTNLERGFANLTNPKLYSHCFYGTKHLIDRYIEEVILLLKQLSECTLYEEKLQRLEFLKDIRHSYGRTALLLSGGGSLGMAHIGVLKSLIENDLLPKIVAGASAGSIIAAVVCTRTKDDFLDQFSIEKLSKFNLNAFNKTPVPFSVKIKHLLEQGAFFDSKVLKECMRTNLGDITFSEAFNRTGMILNISVSSNTMYEMPRLLNYVTAPNVVIWSAVVASCAVPGIFKSGILMAKSGNRIIPWNATDETWLDGSIEK